jgi:hypothetical protein
LGKERDVSDIEDIRQRWAPSEGASRTLGEIEHSTQLHAFSDVRDLLAHLDTAIERAKKAEKRAENLQDAGRALATCAFNLKQRGHLTERERRSLRESQEAWDKVIRKDDTETPP